MRGVCSAPASMAAATGGLGSLEAILPPAIAGFAAARGLSAIPTFGAAAFGAWAWARSVRATAHRSAGAAGAGGAMTSAIAHS